MLSRLATALLAILVTLLAGCSYLKYPNVHKLTIRQGNIINQEMVDQLRPGLSRSQVRYILGTPLIADTFDQSRWDYYFSIKRPGQEELRERLSVYFVDDSLSHFTGDYRPGSAAIPADLADTDSNGPATPGSETSSPETSSPETSSPESYSIEPSGIESSGLESSNLESSSSKQPSSSEDTGEPTTTPEAPETP